MWLTAAIIHPVLKMLSFISDMEFLDSYKKRVAAPIKRLMQKISISEAKANLVEVTITPSELVFGGFELDHAMYSTSEAASEITGDEVDV